VRHSRRLRVTRHARRGGEGRFAASLAAEEALGLQPTPEEQGRDSVEVRAARRKHKLIMASPDHQLLER
jgi:hypothetical protein